MIKYTVVWFRLCSQESTYHYGGLECEQMTKWFDDIVDAERARLVLLNDEFLKFNAQNLRVIQYEFK